MLTIAIVRFDQTDICAALSDLAPDETNRLDFGVIGFDETTVVRVYNTFESRAAGLRAGTVVGQRLFDVVAPCMNNFLVAQRFEDAAATASPLDEVVPYVLTLRMRPVKVRLRLVADPALPMRYVLVDRNA